MKNKNNLNKINRAFLYLNPNYNFREIRSAMKNIALARLFINFNNKKY